MSYEDWRAHRQRETSRSNRRMTVALLVWFAFIGGPLLLLWYAKLAPRNYEDYGFWAEWFFTAWFATLIVAFLINRWLREKDWPSS